MSRSEWYGNSTPCQEFLWFCTHIGRPLAMSPVAAIVFGGTKVAFL